MTKYKQIKVKDFENVAYIIQKVVNEEEYDFVSFFYEANAFGLFTTYLLFKGRYYE